MSLLACRTCGGTPLRTIEYRQGLRRARFECRTCGTQTREGQSLEQALDEWNATQGFLEIARAGGLELT